MEQEFEYIKSEDDIVKKPITFLNEGDYRDLVFMAISIFVIGEFWLASTHVEEIKAAPLEWWICMPFATVMLARTITLYGVAKWLRRWFVHMEPDSSHAGENSEPNKGLLEPIGWLLQCPICVGMHSASVLVITYAFAPDFGWAATIMLAIASGSMLLHHFTELLSWSSRVARVTAGLISPDPGTPGYEARENIYSILKNLNKEK